MKTKQYNKLEKIELFNFSTPLLTCYKNKAQFIFFTKGEIITVLTKKEMTDFIEGKLVLKGTDENDIVNYSTYGDNIKIDKQELLKFIG